MKKWQAVRMCEISTGLVNLITVSAPTMCIIRWWPAGQHRLMTFFSAHSGGVVGWVVILIAFTVQNTYFRISKDCKESNLLSIQDKTTTNARQYVMPQGTRFTVSYQPIRTVLHWIELGLCVRTARQPTDAQFVQSTQHKRPKKEVKWLEAMTEIVRAEILASPFAID